MGIIDEQLLLELYKIGCIKFGQFTLKSGLISPIYIDLRLIISYPTLLKKIASAFWQKIHTLNFQRICGVPYTALPIATAISIHYDIPMVMRRKEAKDYGTKKLIEGVFLAAEHCLVIEDLITSGMSIFETIEPLEAAGLIIQDVVVLLDREQGGRQKLTEKGYHLHSIFTIHKLLLVLSDLKLIEEKKIQEVKEFFQSSINSVTSNL